MSKNSNEFEQEKNCMQSGRWSKEEHQKFIEGLIKYGKNWKKIEDHVVSRSGAQIRSHAQKFFNRLEKDYIHRYKSSQNSPKDTIQGRNRSCSIISQLTMQTNDDQDFDLEPFKTVEGLKDLQKDVQDKNQSNLKPIFDHNQVFKCEINNQIFQDSNPIKVKIINDSSPECQDNRKNNGQVWLLDQNKVVQNVFKNQQEQSQETENQLCEDSSSDIEVQQQMQNMKAKYQFLSAYDNINSSIKNEHITIKNQDSFFNYVLSKLDCYLNKQTVNHAKLSDFVNMNSKQSPYTSDYEGKRPRKGSFTKFNDTKDKNSQKLDEFRRKNSDYTEKKIKI